MKKKILEISKKLGLSHIGSCLSVLPILEEVYAAKNPQDKVILDGAHSHLAHTLFLEEKYGLTYYAEDIIKRYGIHCDRQAGCDVTGGSLGHGIGIGIGIALTDRKRTIYCITTDGALSEGSDWEALRIRKELDLYNLKIIVNMNGYTALSEIHKFDLTRRILVFCPDADIRYTENGKGFEGVQGHYRVLK